MNVFEVEDCKPSLKVHSFCLLQIIFFFLLIAFGEKRKNVIGLASSSRKTSNGWELSPRTDWIMRELFRWNTFFWLVEQTSLVFKKSFLLVARSDAQTLKTAQCQIKSYAILWHGRETICPIGHCKHERGLGPSWKSSSACKTWLKKELVKKNKEIWSIVVYLVKQWSKFNFFENRRLPSSLKREFLTKWSSFTF